MMKQNLLQLKFFDRALGDELHLMLRHRGVRLIIDSLDLAPVFELADDSPKIDHRARPTTGTLLRRL